MRVFLAAVVAMIVIGIGAAFALSSAQRSAGVAYSTDGARIHPKWSWRQAIQKSVGKDPRSIVNASGSLNPGAMGLEDDSAAAEDACNQAGALRWLYVDFSGDSADESGCKT